MENPWKPRRIEYRHSLVELEDEVNKVMIEDCKVDACVDLFISHVLSFQPDPDKYGYRYYVDSALSSVPEDRLAGLTEELQQNLDQLVPGYIDGSSEDILQHEKLKDRVQSRWRDLTGYSHTGMNKNSIPPSLVQTLMENEYRERAGLIRKVSAHEKAAFADSCRQLRGIIEGERATALFSCGGSIPVIFNGIKVTDKDCSSSPPVSIFWSKSDDAIAHKLVLPLDVSVLETHPDTLQRLVADCDAASFGRGEEDVIDPEYRRAGKINTDQFATSFHPANFGILENIAQVLLPSISSETDNQLGFRKITAELYKLNVYSGPSGHFRKHVDTPRAANQIGSLVVCLPSGFQGGRLSVEHHGQKVEFDWSENSETKIQWAAFYSDCEHEIETITQGNRVTLTYNLYVTEPVSVDIPSSMSIVDPRAYPAYPWIRNLLMQEDFMKDGGVLGIFCSHAYPHSSNLAELQLPGALKGADLVLYSVFKTLNLDVEVLPILEKDGQYCDGNPQLGITGRVPHNEEDSQEGGYHRRRRFYMEEYEYDYQGMLQKFLENGQRPQPTYVELLPPASAAEHADLDRRWKLLMLSRRVSGMQDLFESTAGANLAIKEDSLLKRTGAQVGLSRHPYGTSDRDSRSGIDRFIQTIWPVHYLPGITWITEPKHEKMAFSQIAYGNEASIGTRYSCAAILAVVPPAGQRIGTIREN
ncbi:2OG-Fe(II) oxygenase [Aspergillus foveolatus]|uniref:2OG-Fe(II) oxygenase n=1 Tax=Aspergillus foveolatus TaxID=210207 RepID=UPI003CCE49ED